MAGDDVREALNDLTSALDSLSENIWRVRLVEIAEHDPDVLIPKLPELVDLLSSAERLDRNTAAGVIGHIAYEYPSAVAPFVSDIAKHLDEPDAATRQNLLLIFDGVSEGDPDAVKPVVDRIVDQFGDERLDIRVYAAVVVSSVPEIVDDKRVIGDLLHVLLEDVVRDGDTTHVHNVTHAFDQLSSADPTACLAGTSELFPLLESDHAGVRMNVARTLGNMEIVEAREPLKDLLGDDDEDVRQAALAALRNIPETQDERSIESQEGVGYGACNEG